MIGRVWWGRSNSRNRRRKENKEFVMRKKKYRLHGKNRKERRDK